MITSRRWWGGRRVGILAAVGLVLGCQIHQRPPAGMAADDDHLSRLTTGLYQAMAARDTVALDSMLFIAATVLLDTERAEPALIGWQTATALPERRTAGVRIARTEVRHQGELGSVRAVIVSRDPVTAAEFEATDLLTFGRQGGTWRLAHAVFGPWRLRTAP